MPRKQLTAVASRDRRDTLASQAYEAIRLEILQGVLTADRLYSEGQVATVLAISRTPVRQAVQRLALEGLLEIYPQSGFRLRVITPTEAQEHYALREAIETYVVRVLCDRIEESGQAELKRHRMRQQAAHADAVEFINRDEAFHVFLAHAAHLSRAAEFIATLRGVLWLLGTTVLAYQTRRDDVLMEHDAIVEAILARDADQAADAMAYHIRRTAAAALAGGAGSRPAFTELTGGGRREV